MRARILRLLPALLVAIVVAVPTVANAGGGNSGAAKACQKGGWQTLHRADGSSFKNEGECTSYAARGGVFAPQSSLTITGTFDPDNYWTLTVTGTGLMTGSDVTIHIGDPFGGDYDLVLPVEPDGSFAYTQYVGCGGEDYHWQAFGTTASGDPIATSLKYIPCTGP